MTVLTRPWCLLEILEAKRRGIPVLTMGLTGLTWDANEMRSYIGSIEERMGTCDPCSLALLQEHLGAEKWHAVSNPSPWT